MPLSRSQIDLLRKLSHDDRLDASEMSALIMMIDRYEALDKAHNRVSDVLKNFEWND